MHAFRHSFRPARELFVSRQAISRCYTCYSRTAVSPARCSLSPLRGLPIRARADAAALVCEEPAMGKSKAQPDKQSNSNTSCYIQVSTWALLHAMHMSMHLAAAAALAAPA